MITAELHNVRHVKRVMAVHRIDSPHLPSSPIIAEELGCDRDVLSLRCGAAAESKHQQFVLRPQQALEVPGLHLLDFVSNRFEVRNRQQLAKLFDGCGGRQAATAGIETVCIQFQNA